MVQITNNDTGSLKVGLAGAHLKVGDSVQIRGEVSPRCISYIMGAGERTHICCKGTGPMPVGEVEVDLGGSSTPTTPKQALLEKLQGMSIEALKALLQQEEEIEEEEMEEAIEA